MGYIKDPPVDERTCENCIYSCYEWCKMYDCGKVQWKESVGSLRVRAEKEIDEREGMITALASQCAEFERERNYNAELVTERDAKIKELTGQGRTGEGP